MQGKPTPDAGHDRDGAPAGDPLDKDKFQSLPDGELHILAGNNVKIF